MIARARSLILFILAALAFLCAGCASGDGGQIAAGILQGIGAGLSGL